MSVAVLSIQNLDKSYVANQPVLKNISFDVPKEGLCAIIGPSGTGKSTLIRCINRLIEPSKGDILFHGKSLLKTSGSALRYQRRRIGMVFQEYNLVERLSVVENVLCGRLGYLPRWRAWFKRYPKTDIAKAFDCLQQVGLADQALKRASELSGGQRQRVGIARAIMQDPDLLLADEPTSSLDPKTSVEIMQLIKSLCEERRLPVLLNIHDVELAKRFADRIIGLSGGQLIFDGLPSELEKAHLTEIYGGQEWLS